MMKITAIAAAAIITLSPMEASAASLLKLGSRGSEVKTIQTELKNLGYFSYSKATGYYGSITKNAVKRFQKAYGLSADGIVGKKTYSALMAAISAKKSVSSDADKTAAATKTATSTEANEISLLSATPMVETAQDALVQVMPSKIIGSFDWFSKVKKIWDRGVTAVVTDVDTGLSFNVKRTYGTNHADVEPLTKKDTEIIKKIWGGFSWERRAVTVEVGDYIIAGSMTAMPHAGVDSVAANKYVKNRSAGYGYGVNLDAVKNNGVSGVMDIHFKNSRTHSTNVVQKVHQDMIKKAATYLDKLVDKF